MRNVSVEKVHKAAVYTLANSLTKSKMYSGGADQSVIEWNLKTRKAEKVVAKAPTTIMSLEVIKEFNLLAIGQIEGGVHVLDLEQNKEIKLLKAHSGYIFDIKYHQIKNELVVASGDGTLSIWSVPDLQLLYQTRVGSGKIRKINFNEVQNLMSVSCADGFVTIFNCHDWSIQNRIEIKSAVNCSVFIDEQLIVGRKDAHLEIIDTTSNRSIKRIPAHNWAIYDMIRISEIGAFVTASRDKTIKVWDAEKWKVLKRFEGLKDLGHTHSVNSIFWSDDTRELVSTGDDGTLRFWNLEV